MKKLLLFGLLVLLTATSCKKLENEVFFKIGTGQQYKFSDIELYDSSTHIFYFKNEQYEFKDFLANTFAVMDDGKLIYQGSFVPGYSSSIPNGPFIMSPPLYGNYALRIENGNPDKLHDIRNDSRMIDILKQHALLHPGLTISSSSIEITGTQLTFKFTVKNNDQSDLMIIDLDKTGPNLFHYFSNGLIINDLAHNEVFKSNIQQQAPDPWNSWKIDWLSELKSGDSKEYTINYVITSPIIPGEYEITFAFPGLAYQVTKDQLYQGNSRIWLGDITLNNRRTIQ
jgi:hypothetical protein